MKTTLVIADRVFAQIRERAAREGRTISELVEAALRRFLDEDIPRADLPSLPSFDSGGALVDVADRDALYKAMGGR